MKRSVLVLLGAIVGLLTAFRLDVGAQPCRDVLVEPAPACALPQPSAWGLAICVGIGMCLAIGAVRFADWRARR